MITLRQKTRRASKGGGSTARGRCGRHGIRNNATRGTLRKHMASATVTSKGQVTVPKEIRDHLGLEPGDRVRFQIGSGGEVIVEPETVDIRSLRGMLKRRGRRVSLRDMDLAIRR